MNFNILYEVHKLEKEIRELEMHINAFESSIWLSAFAKDKIKKFNEALEKAKIKLESYQKMLDF